MLIFHAQVPPGTYPTALNPKLWTAITPPDVLTGARKVFQCDNEAEARSWGDGKAHGPNALRPEHLGLSSFEGAPGYQPRPQRDPNAPVHHYGTASVARPFGIGEPALVGNLDVASATPIVGGTRLKLHTRHGAFDDPMKFDLYVTLHGISYLVKTLAENIPSGPTYQPEFTLDVDYADLNARLAGINEVMTAQGLSPLQIGPGTALAVNGVWGSGHQWGLASHGKRGGAFIAA